MQTDVDAITRKAILILAMHRSGSSALTRTINLLGAALPGQLIRAHAGDNTGLWESKTIVAVHEELLTAAGSSWKDVAPFPHWWFSSSAAQIFKDRLIEILQQEFCHSPLFVIKDPRMCRLVPLWLSTLAEFGAEPVAILAVRNPLEVVESLRARDCLSPSQSLLLWLHYMLDAERESRGLRRSIVHYAQLLTDWRNTRDQLALDLNINWPRRSSEAEEQINRFLSNGYRHYSLDFSFRSVEVRPEIVTWVKSAYRAIAAPVVNWPMVSQTFDAIRCEMETTDLQFWELTRDVKRETLSVFSPEFVQPPDRLAERRPQTKEIFCPVSNNTSARIRRLCRHLRHFWRPQVHHFSIEPICDRARSVNWVREIGTEPQFLLHSHRNHLPTGWAIISYTVTGASSLSTPFLYVDSGDGFASETAVPLDVSGSGRSCQVILLPEYTHALGLNLGSEPAGFSLDQIQVDEVPTVRVVCQLVIRHRRRFAAGLRYLRRNGWEATKQRILQELVPTRASIDYRRWIHRYDTLDAADQKAIRAHVGKLSCYPLISVVMPVYNTPETYLRAAIESVLAQIYECWELCVADDASSLPHVTRVLREYETKDARIKVVYRNKHGGITKASNSALDLASGEFIALLDHDDELPAHALYMVAIEVSRHPYADLIYSDEDRIDENGKRHNPYFKSDWNPDLLCAQNMVGHLGVYRRSLVEKIGRFRQGFEGSQDYDLALRFIAQSTPDRLRHIPHILYHWRVSSKHKSFSRTKFARATAAARRALSDHFVRRGEVVRVEPAPGLEVWSRIRYPVPTPEPLVSLIVPTRDKVHLLRRCIDGLLHHTAYRNIEVIIIDNDSSDSSTHTYLASLASDARVRILRYNGAFNFSAINNLGVTEAKGNLIGFINNDIIVIESAWLREMVSHAIRPEVGGVGAKLYYPNDTVQHGGVVLGIHGVAGHSHRKFPRYHPGYFGRLRLVQNVSCVTAACLIMRRDIFDEIRGFDDVKFAVSFNDVDLCLRIREHGYLIVWTPYAELYHLESASRGTDKDSRVRFEIACMKEKWGNALLNDPYYNPNLTLSAENFSLADPPRAVKPWLRQHATPYGTVSRPEEGAVSQGRLKGT